MFVKKNKKLRACEGKEVSGTFSPEGILDWLATVLSFRKHWSSTLEMKRRHGH
jgi:hypothetical protein